MAADQTTDQPGPQDDAPAKQASISPAMRGRLQRCFERGTQLAGQDKPDHDYAHDMFVECVVNDPGNLVYVEALLDNLQRKYHDNKKGGRGRGFGGRGAFKKAVTKQDWPSVFRLGLVILKTNPWDVPTLRALAEVCAAEGHNEVELRYLKNALDANLKDKEVNRHCAKSLARMGQFDQAIACWHRVEEVNKDDPEARKSIGELTLAKTQYGGQAPGKAGGPAAGGQEGGTAKQGGDADAEKHREIKLTPRQRLERAIEKDATELQNYLELAELHSGENRYRDAEMVLRKALAISGNDLQILAQVEDAQIGHARTQLAIAEQRAATDRTEEAAELVRQLRGELNRQETDVFYQRAERHPEDKGFKYELGIRLKRAGNYAEAIGCFQEARGDAKYNLAALLDMGECLQQTKRYDKALQCYLAAAKSGSSGDADRLKLALYRAGVLATALRQLEVGEKCLAQLCQLDPDFKDAAARLDKIRKIRDKG